MKYYLSLIIQCQVRHASYVFILYLFLTISQFDYIVLGKTRKLRISFIYIFNNSSVWLYSVRVRRKLCISFILKIYFQQYLSLIIQCQGKTQATYFINIKYIFSHTHESRLYMWVCSSVRQSRTLVRNLQHQISLNLTTTYIRARLWITT